MTTGALSDLFALEEQDKPSVVRPRVFVSLEQRSQDMADKLLSEGFGPRGPDPDFESIQEQLTNLWRAVIRLKQMGPNGDTGVGLWPVILSAASVLLTVLGMWASISSRINDSSTAEAERMAALQTSVSDIKDNLREEHDRTTRVEQELRRLSAEQRYARPNP